MSKENGRKFKKLISVIYIKNTTVREHMHVTGEYRDSFRQICSANYRSTQKVLAIFHNLNGYDSHHIMQEIGKFDQKIKILNGMEKDMIFMLGKNVVLLIAHNSWILV